MYMYLVSIFFLSLYVDSSKHCMKKMLPEINTSICIYKTRCTFNIFTNKIISTIFSNMHKNRVYGECAYITRRTKKYEETSATNMNHTYLYDHMQKGRQLEKRAQGTTTTTITKTVK